MQPIARGRDADVFDHGSGLVLRRYRDGRSAEREGRLMQELAARGYPVPAVRSAVGADLVMERVDGPTLGAQAMTGATSPAEVGDALAALHRRLHALAWGETELHDLGVPALEGSDPQHDHRTVVHLDLHPFNVLSATRGPVVIDWCNARRGPAGRDVAMTALILAEVVVSPSLLDGQGEVPGSEDDAPAPAPTSAATPARLLRERVTGVLASFAAASGTAALPHLDHAVARRRRDPNLSEQERARLDEGAALVRAVAASAVRPAQS